VLNVIGLNGKTFKMDVRASSYPMRTEEACKSKLQFRCGQLIKKCYGMVPILEEVFVPNHGFYLDFFLPNHKIVFEIHGAQHDTYTPYFHKSKANFAASKNRDSNKKLWCEMNDFTFYEIRTEKELKELLGLNDESIKS
jgi:hypothetical protein